MFFCTNNVTSKCILSCIFLHNKLKINFFQRTFVFHFLIVLHFYLICTFYKRMGKEPIWKSKTTQKRWNKTNFLLLMLVLLACQCLGWSTGGRPGDKVPGSSRPFQERRAITCACAHAKVFRRVINHMRKWNFWLHVFTT